MEGVKNEIRRQIMLNFYRKNLEKGKLYTIEYFRKSDGTSKQVFCAIARVECGESHLKRKVARVPQKLSKAQETQIVESMENKNGSSL